MGKFNLSQAATNVRNGIVKHSPEILTGLGIAGMVTSTVLAVKATPKALRLIEHEKEAKEVESLTPVETVKTAWKCYIPATATAAVSVACLIGASSTNLKRNAALATAYKISETAFSEYREKVIESIGEKKERTIKEKVHKNRIEQNPVSKTEVVITENGSTLCYDYSTGRYFKSDIDRIKRAVNEINRRLLIHNYISVNEFYDEIGLASIKEGDRLGWNIDGGLIELEYSSHLSDTGAPCLVIDFRVPPKYDFDKFF